jgi:uncharacterized protein (DUF1330 family)
MPIEPTSADLQRFAEHDDGRPLVLVQLLRFNEGGRDRYLQYSPAAQAILTRMGAQVLYAGECTEALVGDRWDAVVLVRYPSRAAYLACSPTRPSSRSRTCAAPLCARRSCSR